MPIHSVSASRFFLSDQRGDIIFQPFCAGETECKPVFFPDGIANILVDIKRHEDAAGDEPIICFAAEDLLILQNSTVNAADISGSMLNSDSVDIVSFSRSGLCNGCCGVTEDEVTNSFVITFDAQFL